MMTRLQCWIPMGYYLHLSVIIINFFVLDRYIIYKRNTLWLVRFGSLDIDEYIMWKIDVLVVSNVFNFSFFSYRMDVINTKEMLWYAWYFRGFFALSRYIICKEVCWSLQMYFCLGDASCTRGDMLVTLSASNIFYLRKRHYKRVVLVISNISYALF